MPNKIDLNAPAFGVGAQKLEEADPTVVVKPQEEPSAVVEEEKPNTVKYSRFKQWHDRALEAEREAAEWRQKAETQVRQEPEIDTQEEAYKLWVENFGDTEASRKAWRNQLRITEALEEKALERAEQRAMQAIRDERLVEAAQTEANIEKLDNNFEDLEALVGRELTDNEQSAILDIVDDYTPKDNQGNYLGEILPFEKAWEIYELKQQADKAPKIQSRNQVAGLTNRQSQGELSIEEKNKNFNPLDWNAWRNRI